MSSTENSCQRSQEVKINPL